MKEIYWNKLNTFSKFILCLGWLSVLNLGFWIVLLIHSALTQEEKFWNPKSLRVVYVFGWIHFISFIILILVLLVFGVLNP